jgi:DUF1680 family protein
MTRKSFFILALALIARPAGNEQTDRIEGSLKAVPLGQVKLLDGEFKRRFDLNRRYVMSLKKENLLQNYYQEAGLWSPRFRDSTLGGTGRGDEIHWGWESPTCQLRGHFLGHWLSAVAFMAASMGDKEAEARANVIVSELARCQERNGGEWAASIPEKYFHWIAEGKGVWAPHYTVHKTFMGLIDVYRLTGNTQALETAEKFARWFYRWTEKFSREEMDDILDSETGGILEVWADLYGLTRKPMYLDLIERYKRSRLFDPLLQGDDPLTNRHANTTIPEAYGAARVYEVTGDVSWRKIAEAYWKSAVTDRGYYCTGGQTSGEIWSPPFELSSRLGPKNQEHCTVYNMIRLADYLFRWTGDAAYADYIERNIHNGILAQQHPETGMIAYFLPLQGGAKKLWGTPTHDFWCCHGTLVQAHTRHDRYIYYQDEAGLVVAQYIPSEITWNQRETSVKLSQRFDSETGRRPRIRTEGDPDRRPGRWVIDFDVRCEAPAEFSLRLRLPWWLSGMPQVSVNGEALPVEPGPSRFYEIRKTWKDDRIRLILPKSLTTCSLLDKPDTVAFMDGPVVLAGLCGEERILYGDARHPSSMLTPDDERQWFGWLSGYRTVNQERGFKFIPLYEVIDQTYSVYFPIRPKN